MRSRPLTRQNYEEIFEHAMKRISTDRPEYAKHHAAVANYVASVLLRTWNYDIKAEW